MVGDDLEPADEAASLSIVIVTHESSRVIRGCLESLPHLTPPAEVIVVDNVSTDGTPEIVANGFPDVRLIRKSARHGFSVNCNIGAAVATGARVMLLNPDTVTEPGAIETLLEYLDDHPEVGAVGPRLTYPDGSPQPSARRFPELRSAIIRRTPLRLILPRSRAERRHLMVDGPDDEVRDADWLLGAAIMLRAAAFRSVGGLDDGYRLYCEDIDLCWRLHEAGWAVRYLPTATIRHELGELTRKRLVTVQTIWHIRGMARFLRQHCLGRPAQPAGLERQG